MFFSAMSIAMLYYLFTGQFKKAVYRNEQLKWYLIIILLFSSILFLILLNYDIATGKMVKNAFFIVISTISTTGYYLKDFHHSELSIVLIIFILMFIGGFSGSTTGGVKIVRILTLAKYVHAQFKRLIHPQAILRVNVNGETVRPERINIIFVFCLLYIVFFICGAMILCLCGQGLIDAMSMSASLLGNIGPAIGSICTDCSYASLPAIAKWAMSFLMLAGRLEIFSLVALFSIQFWRN